LRASDIAGLAASIEKIGLLYPVVVMSDSKLIAGERCLAAFKLLGRDRSLATTVDLDRWCWANSPRTPNARISRLVLRKLPVVGRVNGIEPSSSAWKGDASAVISRSVLSGRAQFAPLNQ
jgi:hypothetical protein